MSLLSPAIRLMNRLKYPQKFALISFIFILPISWLIYSLFSELYSRIEFSRKELVGTEYLRPLQELSRQLMQYQFFSDRAGYSAQESRPVTQLSAEIESNLAKLQALDQAVGQGLQTTQHLQPLGLTWSQLQANRRTWSPETSALFIQILLEQTRDLRFRIGDQSNLILDPDLDTYYAMDATLLKLPDIQRQLGEIRLLSQQIQANREIIPQERSQLLISAGTLLKISRDLDSRMEVAFTHNPRKNLRPALSTPLHTLSRGIQTLVQQVNQLAYANSPAAVQRYQTLAEESLEDSERLWNATIAELDVLLQSRINAVVQHLVRLVLLVVLFLAIAAYLFSGLYASLMQVVSSLSAASQRMIQGDAQPAIGLESRDELAEVVQSFNAIADALRAAEAKYRGIFENAAGGIFQTSPEGHYLTVNPMLARIYGYDSPEELLTALTDIEHQLYVDPDRRGEFIRFMREVGQIQNFESQVYRKDRTVIWISEAARTIYSQEGELIGYEGTVEDITQRKQAEAEIVRLTQRLQDENLRMSAELEVTRRLQHLLLPADAELQKIADLDIAGFMEPAAEVGGDYYDVMQQNGKVTIGIGDVTGHGLESGMVMIMAQTAVRTLLANGETNSAKFLNAVNRTIYDNTRRMRSPKNMSLALLEYDAGVLCLTGQHEVLIIIRADGRIEPIDTLDLGFPLGLESDITSFVAEARVKLEANDVAVLYTDGITEAMNAQKQQYGLKRMYQVLQEYRHTTALEIRKALIEDLMRHIGDEKVFDDITLLILKRK